MMRLTPPSQSSSHHSNSSIKQSSSIAGSNTSTTTTTRFNSYFYKSSSKTQALKQYSRFLKMRPSCTCAVVPLLLFAHWLLLSLPTTDAFIPSKSQRVAAPNDKTRHRGLTNAIIIPTTAASGIYSPVLLLAATEGSDQDDGERVQDNVAANNNKNENSKNDKAKPASASKRKMLSFALPALGIFLCNPLLSNIDNAFVGKTVGTAGLAALSPATICTDQMIYLFSFLGRATTGLVSRSYQYNDATGTGDTAAARDAAASPLSVALIAGVFVTMMYAFLTPQMLTALKVEPALRGPASSYIYWRGAIVWAALAQNVVLNIQLATRDAMTPLKIVALAAIVNVIGDATCCVWPFRMGCGGAAAATAFATLFSSSFMMRSLYKKGLLPKLKIPNRKELLALLEFTGPLLAITLTRLLGSINMQRAASRLGVLPLAAYQMSTNLMYLFMLFGEPLSQLSQTQLPALVDTAAGEKNNKGPVIRATLKSILILATMAAIGVGGIAGLALRFGTGMFSSDPAVQALAKGVAPSLFCAVATGVFTIAVDGSMLASRDFGFMLFQGTLSLIIQWFLLASSWCDSVSAVLATFAFRLGTYAMLGLARMALGFGPLGRALRSKQEKEIPGDDINGASGVTVAS